MVHEQAPPQCSASCQTTQAHLCIHGHWQLSLWCSCHAQTYRVVCSAWSCMYVLAQAQRAPAALVRTVCIRPRGNVGRLMPLWLLVTVRMHPTQFQPCTLWIVQVVLLGWLCLKRVGSCCLVLCRSDLEVCCICVVAAWPIVCVSGCSQDVRAP